jgi:hypothetical protein
MEESLEKLVVTQLPKFPLFYGTRRFIITFTVGQCEQNLNSTSLSVQVQPQHQNSGNRSVLS